MVCDSLLPCESKFRNHYWGRVKDGANWFFSRDNRFAFCPFHIPDYVRAKRAPTMDSF